MGELAEGLLVVLGLKLGNTLVDEMVIYGLLIHDSAMMAQPASGERHRPLHMHLDVLLGVASQGEPLYHH